MARFNQMSTKKLNALLNNESTSAEDKAAIQEVLNTRNAASASAETPASMTPELTPEEQAAIAAAEGKAAHKNEEKPANATANKMTDEERTALAEKLRAEAVNHRCEVVPFNSLEWVPGVITSVIEEKRTNKVMFAVKTDDGRRIVKVHDSQLIKILDEVVEPAKKVRSNKKTALDVNGNPIPGNTAEDWSDKAIEEAVKEVIANVGKTISYPEAGAYGEVAENAPIVSGRIVSLVPNKRQQTILYRIELDQTEEEVAAKATKKYAHKVTTNEALVIADELDEVGQKINDGFVARRYKESAPKVQMTPEEAYKAAEASLNKAKEALAKAQATLEKRQAAFDEAKAAFEAQGSDSGEDGGQGEDDNDMM